MRDTIDVLKPNHTRFYLVRHGETEWNRKKLMQGHADSPLTDTGIAQTKEVREMLKNIHFQHAVSSDSGRAKRTAELILTSKKTPLQTTSALREHCFGPFEGKPLSFFQKTLETKIRSLEKLPTKKQMTFQLHPEIETFQTVATRVIKYLQNVSTKNMNRTILVVTHATAIRSVFLKLQFADHKQLPHGAIKNSGFAVIDSDGKQFFLRKTINFQILK